MPSPDDNYQLIVEPAALRAIADKLPEAVAAAVAEFITGELLRAPYRVGRALHRELLGKWSARRGTYRVLYLIEEDTRIVRVLDIAHRSRIYRSRWR